MNYFKLEEDRVNLDKIVLITTREHKGIHVYLQGGHEMNWTFKSEDERDKVLDELDSKMGLSDKGSLDADMVDV